MKAGEHGGPGSPPRKSGLRKGAVGRPGAAELPRKVGTGALFTVKQEAHGGMDRTVHFRGTVNLRGRGQCCSTVCGKWRQRI